MTSTYCKCKEVGHKCRWCIMRDSAGSRKTSKREAVLEALLVELLEWVKLDLSAKEFRHLDSYTHGSSGYEEAQGAVQTIIEERLTKPDGEKP